jgi:hypothetical protein
MMQPVICDEHFESPCARYALRRSCGFIKGASDQFMNQHLLDKMCQLCVANLGNSLAKAGPMSAAIALGLTCDWRLDLAHFPYTAE